MDEGQARQAIRAWGLNATGIEPIPSGHINLTWRIDTPEGRYSLQRVNPVFDPAIHEDIQVITDLLEKAGVPTPRLVPAGDKLFHVDERDGVWRLLNWIDGEVLLRADSPERCREAGSLLGRFHKALWLSDHQFKAVRPGVHDTVSHLLKLKRVLESHLGHPSYEQVAPLAEAILEESALLRLPENLVARVVHGDPKISNFVFDENGRALSLLDLDTLARMPIPVELGDAFRSWCSPGGEESESHFRLPYFKAGLSGWMNAVGDLPFGEELEAVPPTVEVIALELAARFCTDALEETYFRWDEKKFPHASAHNQVRTRSQLSLARSVREKLPDMQRIVDDLRNG